MQVSSYRIVRRAFGEYHNVEIIEATWVASMRISMKMQAYNGNGEYFVYRADETYPVGCYCPPLPYVSSAAQQFAPGSFVTHGTSDKVGVTRAIADEMEANPLVLVKWVSDVTEEWVRSEYLYLVRVRN